MTANLPIRREHCLSASSKIYPPKTCLSSKKVFAEGRLYFSRDFKRSLKKNRDVKNRDAKRRCNCFPVLAMERCPIPYAICPNPKN